MMAMEGGLVEKRAKFEMLLERLGNFSHMVVKKMMMKRRYNGVFS